MAFIFYDVETTGLNKRFDQILQFSAVRTDVDLAVTERLETRSRLLPHIVPSPKALHVTGMTLDDITNSNRQSHYEMTCRIANTLTEWSPATFLGFNSISFDEEFLRQAFYHCLHPIFLTNRNGNSRADVLNLMRAAATLYPSVIRPGMDVDGKPNYRLGSLASANGIDSRRLHDATADVDITLELCRIVRSSASELWSAFLRFSSKAAVVDFIREEPAFAYFDFFGTPNVMHLLTRVGVSPNDANAHYCLDLRVDIDALRKLDAVSLRERLLQEPRPIRRLKANASPLLYPIWDIDPTCLRDMSEEECTRIASSVQSDEELISALSAAAATLENAYPLSEHVELQIYGGRFYSDADTELCRQFHTGSWKDRLALCNRFSDQRLRRLSRRLIYFENPGILGEIERSLIEGDILERRRGDGKYASAPWTTIPTAISELETLGDEISAALKKSYHGLR